MAKSFATTNEAAAIKKQLKSITVRGKAWQEDVQICAVNIINHVSIHHETSLINQLLEAMPKGARLNAITAFFDKYAKAVYNDETKAFDPVRDEEYELPEDVEFWYDLKPEPEYKPFDLNAKVIALIKQAEKVAKKANEQDTIDPATLTALRTLVDVAA